METFINEKEKLVKSAISKLYYHLAPRFFNSYDTIEQFVNTFKKYFQASNHQEAYKIATEDSEDQVSNDFAMYLHVQLQKIVKKIKNPGDKSCVEKYLNKDQYQVPNYERLSDILLDYTNGKVDERLQLKKNLRDIVSKKLLITDQNQHEIINTIHVCDPILLSLGDWDCLLENLKIFLHPDVDFLVLIRFLNQQKFIQKKPFLAAIESFPHNNHYWRRILVEIFQSEEKVICAFKYHKLLFTDEIH